MAILTSLKVLIVSIGDLRESTREAILATHNDWFVTIDCVEDKELVKEADIVLYSNRVLKKPSLI